MAGDLLRGGGGVGDGAVGGDEAPAAVEEARHALDPVGVPRLHLHRGNLLLILIMIIIIIVIVIVIVIMRSSSG